jgi:hypothetical protein
MSAAANPWGAPTPASRVTFKFGDPRDRLHSFRKIQLPHFLDNAFDCLFAPHTKRRNRFVSSGTLCRADPVNSRRCRFRNVSLRRLGRQIVLGFAAARGITEDLMNTAGEHCPQSSSHPTADDAEHPARSPQDFRGVIRRIPWIARNSKGLGCSSPSPDFEPQALSLSSEQ